MYPIQSQHFTLPSGGGVRKAPPKRFYNSNDSQSKEYHRNNYYANSFHQRYHYSGVGQDYHYSNNNNNPGKFQRVMCGNCREYGHVYRKCKKPITSFGVIAFKYNQELEKYQVLMVQRKDTMGFVELIRGKYSALESDLRHKQLMTLFGEITFEERESLTKHTFDELWDKLWLNHNSNCYKNEYLSAKNKFETLDLEWYLANTKSRYTETEWGIPKGRLNLDETPKHCAVREFSEETGYLPEDITPIDYPWIEEEFTGTNYKRYKHVYFIAFMNPSIHKPSIDETNISQIGEIKSVKWFTEEDAIQRIREYDHEKKKIVREAFEVVKNHQFQFQFQRE